MNFEHISNLKTYCGQIDYIVLNKFIDFNYNFFNVKYEIIDIN